MKNVNSLDAMIARAQFEGNKEIRPILVACAKAVGNENKAVLESCYQLARLQAITPEKWAGASKYKGFGDACNQVFGMSEATASRRALVGRVYCQVGEDGKPTYGKYSKYSFYALAYLAESLACDVTSDTLKAVDAFVLDCGITCKTPVREVLDHLKSAGKKQAKSKKQETGSKKTSSDNKQATGNSKVIEVVTENAIAAFGKDAQELAKTANAEQLAILIKLVRAYEQATGVNIAGCTPDALKKIAGVDDASNSKKQATDDKKKA